MENDCHKHTPAPEALALVNNLPVFVAKPWHDYCIAQDCLRGLQHLVTTAETSVYWSTAVLMAEWLSANNQHLPHRLAQIVLPLIGEPTLGKWIEILKTLSRHSVPAETPPWPASYSQIYAEEIESAFCPTDDPRSSLLALRNCNAHGLGIDATTSQDLLRAHEDRLLAILKKIASLTAHVQVVGHYRGDRWSLLGHEPSHAGPASAGSSKDGAYLVAGRLHLGLAPLLLFRPTVSQSCDGTRTDGAIPIPHIYARRDRVVVKYNPVGSSGLPSCFDVSSELDAALGRHQDSNQQRTSVRWDDFLAETRIDADTLVGRTQEVATVKEWLRRARARTDHVPALGAILGAPGVGKSALVSKVVYDASNAPAERQGIFYHRFRTGDGRNSRSAFLRHLQDALWAWPPLRQQTSFPDTALRYGTNLERDVCKRLSTIKVLLPFKNQKPAFIVAIDGLDEASDGTRALLTLISTLAASGGIFLVSSRPLGDSLESLGPTTELLFPRGLPPLDEAGVRAMLHSAFGPGFSRIAEHDTERLGKLSNPYVSELTRRSEGFPLIVKMFAAEIEVGRYSLGDCPPLPFGLYDFYTALLSSLEVSTVGHDLARILAALACLEEPIGQASLASVAFGPESGPNVNARLETALRARPALFRTVTTSEAEPTVALCHQSLRDFITGAMSRPVSTSEAPVPTPNLKAMIELAQATLCRHVLRWHSLQDGLLLNHLFRWGIRYLHKWAPNGAADHGQGLLMSFDYLHARLQALTPNAAPLLISDYRLVERSVRDETASSNLVSFCTFFTRHANAFGGGFSQWPASHILLQLACEEAVDHPVAQAAQHWLATSGKAPQLWLRDAYRPQTTENPLVRVYSGSNEASCSVALLTGERFLLLNPNGTVQVWSSATGQLLTSFTDTRASGLCTALSPNNVLATWSRRDVMISFWDLPTGCLLAQRAVHEGALPPTSWRQRSRVEGQWVSEYTFLSWGRDGRLILWTLGESLTTELLGTHTTPATEDDEEARFHSFFPDEGVRGVLTDGQPGTAVSWGDDPIIRVWDLARRRCRVELQCGIAGLASVCRVSDSQLCAVDDIGQVFLCNTDSAEVHNLTGPGPTPEADFRDFWTLKRINADLILVSTGDGNGHFHIWNWRTRERTHTLRAITGNGDRALRFEVFGERYAFESHEHGQREWPVWDCSNGSIAYTLRQNSFELGGHVELSHNRLLTWDGDLYNSIGDDYYEPGNLYLWDTSTGARLHVFSGHATTPCNVYIIDDNRFVSWSTEPAPRIWCMQTGRCLQVLHGHTNTICGATRLPNNDLLTWSNDGTARQWTLTMSTPLSPKHNTRIWETLLVSNNALLTRSGEDSIVRYWRIDNGEPIDEIVGLTGGSLAMRCLDEHHIVVCGKDAASLQIRRLPALDEVATFPSEFSGRIADLWVTPDKQVCVLANVRLRTDSKRGYSGVLRWAPLWNPKELIPLCSVRGDFRYTNPTFQIPGGLVLVTHTETDRDENTTTVHFAIWDPWTGLEVASFRDSGTDVTTCTPIPDGRFLTCHSNGSVSLWSAIDGQRIRSYDTGSSRIRRVFIVDATQFLACAHSGELQLWSLETGRLLTTLKGHANPITGLILLDHRRLLSWSADSLRLWDLQKFSCSQTLRSSSGAWHIVTPTKGQPLTTPVIVGASRGRHAGLLRVGEDLGFHALWHGDGAVVVRHILPDLTLVVTVGDGRPRFLHLQSNTQIPSRHQLTATTPKITRIGNSSDAELDGLL